MFSGAKLCAAVAFSVFVSIASFADASPLAKRGPSVLVGFRTVGAGQAEIYRKAGNKLVWSPPDSSAQIGPGTYISPKLGEWPGDANDWYCAILADASAWNLVNKAWLPETGGGKPLWKAQGAPNVPAFLKKLGGPGFTVANTVLFSKISGNELLQLALPQQLQPGLSTVTQCAKKTDAAGVRALAGYGTAKWSSWPNIKGVVQTVHSAAK
ncbi:MAG: hypothetical protein M1829_002592 [Trizodia sp. TS-e1964]|nr:MAG: hypothetical protein M1829_002592 [Trizodia sp. TS-e1964]